MTNGWEQNVKNHEKMLEDAISSGMTPGQIGHIRNQLNQAKQDAFDYAASQQRILPVSGSFSDGGTSSSSSSSPSPPPPKPPAWITTSNYVEPKGVKQAEPDIVIFNDEVISPELLVQLQFEDIGGLELINISRSDMIDGQDVVYSPIKQLARLRASFNPNNIISLPTTSESFFSRFAIDLILRGMNEPYFNENGDLVIEIEDVKEDEFIQVEIDTNGTINRVDFT